MKRRSFNPSLAVAALAAAGLVACAHTPTDELVDARQAYSSATHGPASELAATEVYEAKQALTHAERAHNDKPGSILERDLAYVAKRKADRAIVTAEFVQAREQLQEAKTARYATLEGQRDQSQRDLGAARTQLTQKSAELDEAHSAQRRLHDELQRSIAKMAGMATISDDQEDVVITLSGEVLFRQGSANLMPVAEHKLGEVADVLKRNGDGRTIEVVGHTDSTGSDAFNRDLSLRRAEAVADYLVSRGVSRSALTPVGRGEAMPIATNDTATGRANNRRVELVISADEGTQSGESSEHMFPPEG